MNETQRILAWGAYINGALYLAGVFVAGLVTQHPPAWKGAVAAAGISFMSYTFQLSEVPRLMQLMAVGASIGMGAAAGVLLLL